MDAGSCLNSLSNYEHRIESLINRIERGFKIHKCLNGNDGTGILLYGEIHDKVHNLKVLVTKLQVVVEDEKRKLNLFKVKLSQLQLIDRKINHLMAFSLQNSDVNNESTPSFSSVDDKLSAEVDKENLPDRIKVLEKRKFGVPSLNPISSAAFEKVPKYMRGRLTLPQINAGITDINLILSKKYQILNRPRKALSLKEEKLRSVYLEQGKDLKGTCHSTFFVDDDIQRYSTSLKLQNKTRDNIFLVLRHLGKMKEVHKGKLNRHCILTT